MRNKTKAAVTINRLGEKQGEGGGETGDFWGSHGSQGGTERRGNAAWGGGGGAGGTGEERGRDFPPPRPFLQATNNEYSVIMTF